MSTTKQREIAEYFKLGRYILDLLWKSGEPSKKTSTIRRHR